MTILEGIAMCTVQTLNGVGGNTVALAAVGLRLSGCSAHVCPDAEVCHWHPRYELCVRCLICWVRMLCICL